MKRKLNQDYIYASGQAVGNLPNLFIVADGMGGHKAGDYASKCTVETICDLASRSFEKNPVLILKKAIETANGSIRKKSAEDESYEGMGTTVVAASCLGKYLQIANVGDSRLYVIGEEITQITKDHSLVEEMIRMGGIDRNAARNHPDKNIITRAIGATDTVDIDFFSVELKPQEKVLMCSDGLTNMLEDEEIRMIVQGSGSIEGRAKELVSAANERGGKDNISVILIEQTA
jgi:protein phosphatase